MKISITSPTPTLPSPDPIDPTRCHFGRCGSTEVEFWLLHGGRALPYCYDCARSLEHSVPVGTLVRFGFASAQWRIEMAT